MRRCVAVSTVVAVATAIAACGGSSHPQAAPPGAPHGVISHHPIQRVSRWVDVTDAVTDGAFDNYNAKTQMARFCVDHQQYWGFASQTHLGVDFKLGPRAMDDSGMWMDC
jgi:hypothetical protein